MSMVRFVRLPVIFLMLLSVNTFAQSKELFGGSGQWYQQNINLYDSNDSIILKQQITNYSFKLWHFKKNTLTISIGTLRENNPNAKCFGTVRHYSWGLMRDNEEQILRISFGDTTKYYKVLDVDNNTLLLIAYEANVTTFEGNSNQTD